MKLTVSQMVIIQSLLFEHFLVVGGDLGKDFYALTHCILIMNTVNKTLTLTIISLLLSSLLVLSVAPVNVQAVSKPSVPQFTVKFVDSYYDIPPSTTTTIDTYTGQEITLNIPGNIVHRHIEVTIKNQHFTPYKDSNGINYYLYFFVQSKGSFGDEWQNWGSTVQNIHPMGEGFQSSTPELYLQGNVVSGPANYAAGAQVDFRVEARIGHYYCTNPDSMWAFMAFEADVTSGWSNVQTFTMPSTSSSSPSQTAPLQNPPEPPNYNQPQYPEQTQPPSFVLHSYRLLWIGTLLFVGVIITVVIMFAKRHLKNFTQQPSLTNNHKNYGCFSFMKKRLTKLFALLFVVLITMSFFGALSTPFANQTVMAQYDLSPIPPRGTNPPLDPSQTLAAQEKALNIMRNVISIDFSKYTLTLDSSSILDAKPLSEDTREITVLKYVLTPLESIGDETAGINIFFNLEKDVVTSYYIMPVTQIITNTQYVNQRNAIVGFLEKYQIYTHIDSSNLIAMLNDVDLTKSSTTTQGNIKLKVSADSLWGVSQVNLRWTYTVKGADYTALEITVNARGFVTYMFDDRALYTIGDTSVNISMEQAVDIAIENLWTYSYEMHDGTVVKDFKVDKDATLPVLCVVAVDYVLRPYWDVSLYLDEVYPGSVFGIKVLIWADTGEIISYGNMADGGISSIDNVNFSDADSALGNVWVFVGVMVVAVAVAALVIGAIIVKKRHR